MNIITFWYGTNDWATSQVLGTISDMGTEESAVSFYGALNYCAKWLSEHLPDKNIIFITPLQRIDGQAIALGTTNGLDDNGKPKNNNGNTLEDFANAVIDVAQKWAIPCYDAHRLSNVNAVSAGAWDSNFIPTQYEDWEEHYTGRLLYDGLHYKMGSKGAEIFANKIANFIADNM